MLLCPTVSPSPSLLCRCQDNEPDDCGCQGDIHSVVVTGGSHPVVNVTIPNSVDGRLASALRYLHANYPKEGWDAFTRPGTVVGADTGTGTRADADTGRPLTGGTSSSSPPGDAGDRDREDGHEGVDGGTGGGHRPPLLDPAGVSIDWGRTIVSGHSQGAGHAAWLAMAHATVAGAVPISGPQVTIPPPLPTVLSGSVHGGDGGREAVLSLFSPKAEVAICPSPSAMPGARNASCVGWSVRGPLADDPALLYTILAVLSRLCAGPAARLLLGGGAGVDDPARPDRAIRAPTRRLDCADGGQLVGDAGGLMMATAHAVLHCPRAPLAGHS